MGLATTNGHFGDGVWGLSALEEDFSGTVFRGLGFRVGCILG